MLPSKVMILPAGMKLLVRSLRRMTTIGPDRILPSEDLSSIRADGAVKLKTGAHPSTFHPPMSVWTMLQNTVDRAPDRTALAVKRDGKWVKWSFKEYQDEVKCVARAFIKLGLKQHHAVGILGVNAPEWHISNVATVIAGGLATGHYTTNNPDMVKYVANHSRANIMVVEDEEQVDKVDKVREGMEELKAVVQYSGEVKAKGVISWKELLEIGREVEDSVLEERLEQQAVNQACILVYTSGTTGNPKGVMISQDNITWAVQVGQENYQWNFDYESGVSYLPLSHVAAQIIDIYLTIYGGATIYFADKNALQGTLVETLKEVRPTKFLGVPRVYEKIQERLMEIGKKNKGVKKAVMDWAKAAALEHHKEEMAGRKGNSLSYRFARWLILKRLHRALGLDRANPWGCWTSAAPLSPETFWYFMSLDIPIMEVLGSSETSIQTSGLPLTGTRPGSVGRAFPQFENKIVDPDEDGVGEIMTRGRHACMGYLWDEEKTRDLVDDEGWIHSGDLGRIDEDGFVYVCGRIKEIIITAGGENIAPVPIEDRVKAEFGEAVSHAMVVGDKMKHLSVIITPRPVMDERGQPTDVLHEAVIDWLRPLGSEATTMQEVVENDSHKVHEAVMQVLEKVNSKAVSRAQRIHKYIIVKDFSVAGGELTPTMKMKRHFILKKYQEEINKMYKL